MPGFDRRRLRASFDGVLRADAPLAPLTYVRIGGPAELLAEPASARDVVRVVRACAASAMPLRVLGGGSNLVIDDGGVRGVVLGLRRLDRIVCDGLRVTAGAGVPLARLLRVARQAGLAGLETLAGIPAQVGGAVRMNAGTRHGETFDRLVSVIVVDRRAGELCELERSALAPRYRDGGLGGSIVVAATFALRAEEPASIGARFERLVARRNATQPAAEHSAGCVFRNPAGDAAGRLIDACGCKGMRVGRIRVSERHANFLVNDGGGTYGEFRMLMDGVRRRVQERSGVALRPEVELWEA